MTPGVNGEFRISAAYTRHFGVRKTHAVVLHACGDDGDGPVPAWPQGPPIRVPSAERDPDDD